MNALNEQYVLSGESGNRFLRDMCFPDSISYADELLKDFDKRFSIEIKESGEIIAKVKDETLIRNIQEVHRLIKAMKK